MKQCVQICCGGTFFLINEEHMKQLFLQAVLLQQTHYGHKWKVIRIGVQQETNKKK